MCLGQQDPKVLGFFSFLVIPLAPTHHLRSQTLCYVPMKEHVDHYKTWSCVWVRESKKTLEATNTRESPWRQTETCNLLPWNLLEWQKLGHVKNIHLAQEPQKLNWVPEKGGTVAGLSAASKHWGESANRQQCVWVQRAVAIFLTSNYPQKNLSCGPPQPEPRRKESSGKCSSASPKWHNTEPPQSTAFQFATHTLLTRQYLISK